MSLFMADQRVSEKNLYSITWSINNFHYCWQKKKEAIVSPIFSIYIPEETRWKLLLFPRGTSDGNYIAFYLERDKDCNGGENIEVEYSLECLTADDSIVAKGKIEHAFIKNNRWGFSSFRSREAVFINERMKYLPHDTLAVRCRMKLSNMLSEKSVESRIFARTIVNVERKSLLWTIKEFSSLTPGETKCLAIKSASKEVLIKIGLFLTGGQCSEEYINLNILHGDRCMKFFTLKTFILNAEKSKVNAGEFECMYEYGKSSTFALKFSRNKLMKDKDVYLPNDVFSLNLELATSNGFAFEGIEKINFGTISHETTNEVLENWWKCNGAEKITENSCALINDLMSLYKDLSLCDVKLQTKTNIFPAHTLILSARSPVFRAMFSTNMKEKLNGYVDVSDLDDETVHRLLLYLYSDNLEELKWKNAIQLYKAADKYTIISLKDRCSLVLKDKLDLVNACETLLLSDLHQDERLKIITQDFILRNAKEIFKSEKWKLLADANSKLALETTLRNWNEE